jgi:ribosomal protein S18 acetylase RimI-like enzyme
MKGRRKVEKIAISAINKMQIPEVIALLGRAYATNPINIAVFGKDNVRSNERLFSLALKNMQGQTFVAELEDAIIGVVRIVKYPQCVYTKMEQLELMPKLLLASKSAKTRFIEWRSAWDRLHPRENHYHFGFIAVLPEYQHRRIGSKMMGYCCRILDCEAEAGYLETDRAENLAFYYKFGFKVISELTVLGVPNWFMKRFPSLDSQHCEEYLP